MDQLKANKERPSAATVLFDERTGKFYYGKSGEPYPSIIHPDLESSFPTASLAGHGRPPINCAECKALNDALLDGAKLENLHGYTFRPRTGNMMPRCSNCQVTVPDPPITIWSDSLVNVWIVDWN
jgi:hypothetical protein